MVRATAAEMLKLSGGAYVSGQDATSYGNFAAQADAELDTMALPGTLSTTDSKAIALANREAYRFMLHAVWSSAGGVLSGFPEPMCLYHKAYYEHVQKQVKKLMASTDYGSISTIDLIET